jgi:tousled-like kinase
LEEREARQIIKQIISALYYLSMLPAQVIHYDLKPQNIMINEGHIKIIDFGLCKLNDTNESKIELTSQGTGTYWYLPPETFDFEHPAKISNKVDIWSTGVIFYELLYGKRPYGHGQTQNAIITKCLIKNATEVNFDEPPPKPYTVSEEAKDFIRECLQYDQ